jgi:hypothetical protein
MRLTLVTLSDIEMREAHRRAAEIDGHEWIDGDNYTELVVPDRWLTGAIGELAVRKWAEEEGLMYFETTNTAGKPDLQDFIFEFWAGRSTRINVKNSMIPNAAFLMQPEAQAMRHRHQDIYIGASGEYKDNEKGLVNGAVVRLWGWIWRKDFMVEASRTERKCRTVEVRLAKLPGTMEQLASHTAKRSIGRH